MAGWGVAVPVYLEQDEVDLQICLLDRLYQWPIRLHNRYILVGRVPIKIYNPFLLYTRHLVLR